MESETTPLLSGVDKHTNSAPITPLIAGPASKEGTYRTIVLLFDGTGDTDDDDVSNVIELRNMLPKPNPNRQLVFYQPGIGTYKTNIPGTQYEVPLVGKLSRTFDGAIAWSLEQHVVDGYTCIMDNYREGDKICMFGFSRGAYTARAVGAMLNKVGLLPSSRKDKIWDAFRSFEHKGSDTWTLSAAFRKENECRNIPIEFIGVWDTVNSVGALRAKALSNTATNSWLRTFRHAVSLDEHRARFRSNMWNPPSSDPGKQPRPFVTNVDQVWFAGGHCDVGGGSVPNGTRPNLAHIALRWMVRECFRTENGMCFDPAKLAAIGLAPSSLSPKVVDRPPALEPTPDLCVSTNNILKPGMLSRAGSWISSLWSKPAPKPVPESYEGYTEEQLDLVDALAPLYDQLIVNRMKWWALEVAPLQMWSVVNRVFEYRQNHGRGRTILPPVAPERCDKAAAEAKGQVPLHPNWAKVRVHRTVRTRMTCPNSKGERYVPKALLGGLTLDKIDPALIDWVA